MLVLTDDSNGTSDINGFILAHVCTSADNINCLAGLELTVDGTKRSDNIGSLLLKGGAFNKHTWMVPHQRKTVPHPQIWMDPLVPKNFPKSCIPLSEFNDFAFAEDN